MNCYVLYDPMVGAYLKEVCGKPAKSWHAAKQYKRLAAAVSPSTGAGLMNVNRNVPLGLAPNKHYQNLPNVEVHELDVAGNIVCVHAAPPSYIFL